MRKMAIAAFVMSAAFMLCLSATGQQPEQKGRGGKGFPGGFGARPQPGQLMPTFLQERLKLSDDQKKQLADLQKEVDTKIEKLLTDEQRAELKKLREQGPGGGFPGGRGGFQGKDRGPGGKDRGPGGKDRGPGPKE